MMNGKLIKIERTINAYNKKNELLWEIEIDIPIDRLIQIIIPSEDNNLELYDGYELSLSQLQKINLFLENPIHIDLNKESYYLVENGIYDWEQ